MTATKRKSYTHLTVEHALLARSIMLARDMMSTKHMSVKDFAKKANLSTSTIYKHRSGKSRNAYITTVDKMLSVTGKKLLIGSR